MANELERKFLLEVKDSTASLITQLNKLSANHLISEIKQAYYKGDLHFEFINERTSLLVIPNANIAIPISNKDAEKIREIPKNSLVIRVRFTEERNSSDTEITSAKYYLTIKGPKTEDGCYEFETDLTKGQAISLNEICSSGIEKTRYSLYLTIEDLDLKLEFDKFKGKNKGLHLLEIEFEARPDYLKVDLATIRKYVEIAVEDVSDDMSYTNIYLSNR